MLLDPAPTIGTMFIRTFSANHPFVVITFCLLAAQSFPSLPFPIETQLPTSLNIIFILHRL